MIERADYPHPVSQLLDHGPIVVGAADVDNWFDYVGQYELEEMDVPPLIDLMLEEQRSRHKQPNLRDAPIHACRALAQLGDRVGEEYFLFLIEKSQDKVLVENAKAALPVQGQSFLANLKAYFDDPQFDDTVRLGIAEDVYQLGQRLPQMRERCVAFLTKALSNYQQYTYDLNGFFVLGLVELKATEASELIEQSLTLGRANDEMMGSWAAVQVKLGLASEGDFEPDELLCAGDRQRQLESKSAIMLSSQADAQPSAQQPSTDLAGSYSLNQRLDAAQ